MAFFCIFVELIAHKLQPCLFIVMKFYVQNSCVERLQMGFTNHLGASTAEMLISHAQLHAILSREMLPAMFTLKVVSQIIEVHSCCCWKGHCCLQPNNKYMLGFQVSQILGMHPC